ncbi:hypothetical protein BKA70DRAFT_1437659 [Coprinopsis sp. MPI-PUGE-AT-0042]|nr:hypothetical protein BKA70DRAFT_1437659 [Coprinopsis sp. MPI-PUGE-AT-0042]
MPVHVDMSLCLPLTIVSGTVIGTRTVEDIAAATETGTWSQIRGFSPEWRINGIDCACSPRTRVGASGIRPPLETLSGANGAFAKVLLGGVSSTCQIPPLPSFMSVHDLWDKSPSLANRQVPALLS